MISSAGSLSLKFQSLADHYRTDWKKRPACLQRARLSVEINLTSTRYLTDISAEIGRGVGEKRRRMHANRIPRDRAERDALAVGEQERVVNQ